MRTRTCLERARFFGITERGGRWWGGERGCSCRGGGDVVVYELGHGVGSDVVDEGECWEEENGSGSGRRRL